MEAVRMLDLNKLKSVCKKPPAWSHSRLELDCLTGCKKLKQLVKEKCPLSTFGWRWCISLVLHRRPNTIYQLLRILSMPQGENLFLYGRVFTHQCQSMKEEIVKQKQWLHLTTKCGSFPLLKSVNFTATPDFIYISLKTKLLAFIYLFSHLLFYNIFITVVGF